MSKRLTTLDVLGEARRARRILNRLIRYLESQERAERRRLDKTDARHSANDPALASQPHEHAEQG